MKKNYSLSQVKKEYKVLNSYYLKLYNDYKALKSRIQHNWKLIEFFKNEISRINIKIELEKKTYDDRVKKYVAILEQERYLVKDPNYLRYARLAKEIRFLENQYLQSSESFRPILSASISRLKAQIEEVPNYLEYEKIGNIDIAKKNAYLAVKNEYSRKLDIEISEYEEKIEDTLNNNKEVITKLEKHILDMKMVYNHIIKLKDILINAKQINDKTNDENKKEEIVL